MHYTLLLWNDLSHRPSFYWICWPIFWFNMEIQIKWLFAYVWNSRCWFCSKMNLINVWEVFWLLFLVQNKFWLWQQTLVSIIAHVHKCKILIFLLLYNSKLQINKQIFGLIIIIFTKNCETYATQENLIQLNYT